jgi:hypothetical protein
MSANRVCASQVLSTKDLEMRTEQDLTEIVARFLTVGEGVVGHWVEYARGLLLFVRLAAMTGPVSSTSTTANGVASGSWTWQMASSAATR